MQHKCGAVSEHHTSAASGYLCCVSRLSFRARLFIALFVVSAFPLLMVAGWGVVFLKSQPSLDYQSDIAPVGRTEQRLVQQISGLDLPLQARDAMRNHVDTVSRMLRIAGQKNVLASEWQQGRAGAFVVVAGALAALVAAFGFLLSREYAAPLNEIVDWTRRIQRHEPLPAIPIRSTVPELILLQQSLYELQRGLEQARTVELESARLRAFGEVARRVAHEMKNPLTPIRLAVRQLTRRAPPDMQVELEVIAAESARLEAMARDFAELGRLPEGISAPVDLAELLQELLQNTVPEGMEREFATVDGASIEGYYDPLRRAFSNLLRNAVEACNGHGRIAIRLLRDPAGIAVTLSDNGPGIALEKREMIFQPYYSGKADGTGLGLAIVRQTIEQHHGTIAVRDTPDGGATFVVQFPA
jgi:two-component system nitrogen regulation sensor histidine kinase NtrY